MLSIVLQFILPFIIAALVVVAITIIAEKFGTRVGGILGTIPSTIVVAFVFISINRGDDFASRAAAVVPAEMAINLVFLFLFTILARGSAWKALLFSLLIWAALSGALLLLHPHSVLLTSSIYFLTLLTLFLIMEKVVRMRSALSVKVRYTPAKIMFRGLFAGFIIGTTVLLSNIGETISGIFSVFPAIFLSTMLITLKEHGASFSGGMGKSMLLGSQTVVVYVLAVHFLYPLIGALWGTIASFMLSMIMVASLLFFRNRMY
ncbi:MAG: DUF3147 family protein [Thermoplasmatota archaeon]